MILSKRERFIIAATLIVVAAAVLYLYVLTPLNDSRKALEDRKEGLLNELERARTLLARKREIAPKWKEMTVGGLKSDPTEAESLILHSVQDWAREAGLKLASLKPERLLEKKSLQEIAFKATGTGSMNAVTKFLWQLETAKVPVRVKELQLGTRKEGADDLTLQLRLSTLYQSAQPPAPSEDGTAAATTGEDE
ncbi:MAG: type 4a pilus biogenesis protein PilO [Acidobacteria bacterium]|nr:type 4a pilus biogenesis protein PilO [Planctomycetota bacterium]MBE3135581.1 type 4a pilus biogenesis protein PilO [Acidobacteriota bacterium]